MALLTCLIVVAAIGIVVGAWLARSTESGSTIGAVVSAFLGSLVAVTGAAVLQSNKEVKLKEQRVEAVAAIVRRIGKVASDLSDFHTVTKMPDGPIQQAVRSLLHSRDQLMIYRPYDLVGPSVVQLALLDVELSVARLEPLAGDVKMVDAPISFVPGFQGMKQAASPRDVPTVIFHALPVLTTCNVVLKLSGNPELMLSKYQKDEVVRRFRVDG